LSVSHLYQFLLQTIGNKACAYLTNTTTYHHKELQGYILLHLAKKASLPLKKFLYPLAKTKE